MRWPIRIQLLLPMLIVVVLAIALVSVFNAFLESKHTRQIQRENLQRVITTLSEASFPLNEPVLRQMSGLSGAEFVVFDGENRLQASTLRLSEIEREYLQQKSFDGSSSERPSLSLNGRRYLSQRVAVKNRPPFMSGGWLVVLYKEENWAATMWQAAYPALLVGAAAICAIMLVTTLLAHRFAQPIRRLGDQAAAIAEGNFGPLPITRRNDEIRDLTISINRMAERLGRYENEVRRHEQLRALGQLGAGMAHQLRNAATGGRMAIELHRLHCVADETSDGLESLEVALRQLRLMESYLQRFLALGHHRDAPHQLLALVALLEDALELVKSRCVHTGIELVYNRLESPAVRSISIFGDADALRQLFVNLLINAIEAVGGHDVIAKRIEIELSHADDQMAVVKISDTGSRPCSGGCRSVVRAVRNRETRRNRLGTLCCPANSRCASRQNPLAKIERDDLFYGRISTR